MPDRLSLTVEKPAAGGRMIARHEGRIVLVSGAIPGERVTAAVEQVRGGVIYASTIAVEAPSPDRREAFTDPACGGSVYSHITYERQCAIKAEVIADAFRRIGRVPLSQAVPVRPSPEDGYRMRARLHVRGGRLGFFREGTHTLCDPASSRQLLPETIAVLKDLGARLARAQLQPARELELSENVPATERAVLIELAPGNGDAARRVLGSADGIDGLTGLTVVPIDAPDRTASRGRSWVTDALIIDRAGTRTLTLRRHVASFFQGNRYLLESLAQTVADLIPDGPLVDLYAGAGLFGLAFAALGRGPVIAVEGDRHAAQDLGVNARPFASQVAVHASSVETFLSRGDIPDAATLLVDPPRTGLSSEVLTRVGALGPSRIVYVSCDVATLARDVRRLIDARGYALEHIEAFDLFPNTAHVETIVALSRS
ncbi:MAG TPA: TRAM domain-containing protein [Vicinamibacterales bacterium]|nr:TRAM domain-containing protein [Vicinamibacterales bacterium]